MLNQFAEVRWTLLLRVKDEVKARRVLARLSERAGQQFTVVACRPCLKDGSLFAVETTSPLGVDRVEEAVFCTLRVCSLMADRFRVNGPHEYAGGRWEFSGTAGSDEVRLPGVESIDFRVDNFATPTA